MSYKSIFVNIDIDCTAVAPIVGYAAALARDFDAHLTGSCGADIPLPVVAADGIGAYDGETMAIERKEIEARHKELEAEFAKALSGVAVKSQWQASVFDPTQFLVDTARAADLIVTANPKGGHFRAIDIGNLALGAGRPILVAADGADRLSTERALIAWKDTREARRAISDSLPLLRRTREIVVATVEPDPDSYVSSSLNDIVRFLKFHDITARAEQITGQGEDISNAVRSFKADFVVAGAYGHSRLREWIFGGVTRSLIGDTGLNRFLSN
ncbi:nucleotide-binding universal stress UspA family protein [Mesorhizobium soli]|uniref:universal stress protein n=1 Tax=Pseudaminobacter soli (ex Li et al. 2025) TaxID=1295366 RepID=UPI002476A72E|nr:universal stress protein [Mesorhizobium soli]MDH6231862.1 nucleotide-binding universal stress UspA family protein [Mesorhizobium soli]